MTQPADSQLRRAVELMDRLRSPGGCPWDAAQTHESLTRYLIEETYEVLEAIETDDVALLREELGDLLLQVLFHARIAEELPSDQAFGIEDVARDLSEKLIRRHPHVFGDVVAGDAEELNESWERQKVAEKGRTSAVDGVPLAQPALALTAKLVSRAARAGLTASASGALTHPVARNNAPLEGESHHSAGVDEDEIGARLFAVVQDAVAAGVDPETALRRAARAYREAILDADARTD